MSIKIKFRDKCFEDYLDTKFGKNPAKEDFGKIIAEFHQYVNRRMADCEIESGSTVVLVIPMDSGDTITVMTRVYSGIAATYCAVLEMKAKVAV